MIIAITQNIKVKKNKKYHDDSKSAAASSDAMNFIACWCINRRRQYQQVQSLSHY